jgi:hypothetical protein
VTTRPLYKTHPSFRVGALLDTCCKLPDDLPASALPRCRALASTGAGRYRHLPGTSPDEYRYRDLTATNTSVRRSSGIPPVTESHAQSFEPAFRTTLLGNPTRYRKSRSVLRACVLDTRAR